MTSFFFVDIIITEKKKRPLINPFNSFKLSATQLKWLLFDPQALSHEVYITLITYFNNDNI